MLLGIVCVKHIIAAAIVPGRQGDDLSDPADTGAVLDVRLSSASWRLSGWELDEPKSRVRDELSLGWLMSPIGTTRTSRDVRLMSAVEDKPDVRRTAPKVGD